MTHFNTHYDQGTPEERDIQAIKDIREFLSQEQWDALMQYVGDPATTITGLNMALGFTGVSGYPFHAFCRKYALERYREWMASEPDPIQTDERGYRIK